MADRIDREIDEILEKLGEKPSEPKKPIPISSARRKERQPPPRRPQQPREPLLPRLEPATLMFTGAGVMLGGLILSTVAGFFIWAAFAGVLMFLTAFLISFARGWPQSPRPSGTPSEGVFWRDRYIQYDSRSENAWTRIKRKFRR